MLYIRHSCLQSPDTWCHPRPFLFHIFHITSLLIMLVHFGIFKQWSVPVTVWKVSHIRSRLWYLVISFQCESKSDTLNWMCISSRSRCHETVVRQWIILHQIATKDLETQINILYFSFFLTYRKKSNNPKLTPVLFTGSVRL